MNITQENIDKLNSVLTVKISPNDYTDRVEKAIKDHAKKAKIPGFRPGMVPTSHIKRMYGKSILVDEINNLLSDTLNNYIVENKLDILGQPLPQREGMKEFNWDFTEEFEFNYEMGLAPEITIDFSSKDRLKQYIIKVDDQTLSERIANLRRSYGKMTNPEISEGDYDVLHVELQQLAVDGSIFEEGINNASSSLRLDMVKDAEIKKSLIGLKKADVITLDVQKALIDNPTYLAKTLGISEEDTLNLKSKFQVTIKNISRLEESDLNQEFYDKIFGEDIVKTEEEFKAKITEELDAIMAHDAEQKLNNDLYQYCTEKFNFNLPDEFLKRWLKATNEKLSDSEVEEGYSDFAKKMRFSLVGNKITKENNIEITKEDVLETAVNRIRMQFGMYSAGSISEDILKQYAIQLLQNKETANSIFDETQTKHVFNYLKNVITLDKTEITRAEFVKL